jgi:thiopeptide-type bacteriocin biosynthesis protein
MVHVLSGFFVVRTPLLPVEDFLAWGQELRAPAEVGHPQRLSDALCSDRAALRARLRAIVERPEVAEALFLGSSDLDASLPVWRQTPSGVRGRRVERALVRYVTRAATRPTPFGLFAGCSLGRVGQNTRIALAARPAYRRHSRLDMGFLAALVDRIGQEPKVRDQLRYQLNSSLYRAGGKIRYVEVRRDGAAHSHHLVAVTETPHLAAILERARGPATLTELTSALIERGADSSAARRFVEQLVDRQVLVGELGLPLTGPEPLQPLVQQIRKLPGMEPVADQLEQAGCALLALDENGLGRPVRSYRALAASFAGLPIEPVESRLVQVDLIKPVERATLGEAVARELIRGVELLRRVAGLESPTELGRFAEAVHRRYEERIVEGVPLAELLDAESGVGFGSEPTWSPLLRKLPLFSSAPPTSAWTRREEVLLRKLLAARDAGADEIDLSSGDVDELAAERPPDLPDAFAVTASLATVSQEHLDRGRFQLVLHDAVGPSGGRLLGRFCHADRELADAVRGHLAAEEALDPDTLYAEVVHLPEGRLGNVLLRPLLRRWELPYLGRSGAQADCLIPVDDLLVSVSDGRVELRSARLGRRVLPRLTTAHNYRAQRNSPVYRFLCAVQDQDSRVLAWDWGPLARAPFLPRVRSGRVVLSRARWLLVGRELRSLAAGGEETFTAAQRLRTDHGLPRLVVLVDGDNTLAVDLDNVLSVEMFAHLVGRRDEVVLEEVLPRFEELPVEGLEGHFVAELVVPFVRSERRAELTAQARRTRSSNGFQHSFPPGSEWIYAKLYAGPAGIDELLRDELGPLAVEAVASGAADGWFFVRYVDPDWHLRLRLHGDPARLNSEVLPALYDFAGILVARGQVRRLQFDTYQREIERYGGPEGIALSERIFGADSDAVLRILRQVERGDAGLEERWRLALVGVDRLLDAFALDALARRDLMRRLRASMATGYRFDAPAQAILSRRYREHRAELAQLLNPTADTADPLAPGLDIFHARGERLAPLVAELRSLCAAGRLGTSLTDLAASHVHMHVNRMLRSRQSQQELIIYDFLARAYASAVARTGVR